MTTETAATKLKRAKATVEGEYKYTKGCVTAPTRHVLWARAAGRCQYEGCNKDVIGDLIAKVEDKQYGFVAHIVAEEPKGPRGDAVRSKELVNDVRNLMLLCDKHHRTIDVHEVAAHPEERLLKMKAAHEQRVATVTAIEPQRATHLLRYAANIGPNESPVADRNLRAALLPGRHPAEWQPIDLELGNSALVDREADYWSAQRTNLQRLFEARVRPRVASGEIGHLSVFALAPQPLLIELGRLISDIKLADVHQLKREPAGWGWVDGGPTLIYHVRRPRETKGEAALVLGLSATIADERVTRVLGEDAAIWTLTLDEPHNDVLRHEADLVAFRQTLRRVFDAIKAAHGENASIHVFPALPASAAVEVGRAWQPKADLPLRVYDQNRDLGGFAYALTIGGA